MPHFFIYLLKVNIALALFYIVYRFVLRRLTFYKANRFYLLFAICFSSIFPLVHFPANAPVVQQQPAFVLRSLPDWNQAVTIISNPGASWTIWDVLYIVYWAGVLVMGLVFLTSIVSLVRLWNSSRKVPGAPVHLRTVEKNISPFTFWNAIFINPAKHTEQDCISIIRHEAVHVRQRHSFDILLAEVNKIFYWFNPGAWMMKNAIRENLEFIADEQIISNGADKTVYQLTLVQAATGMPLASGITSSFAFAHLKNRIKMMNKKRSAGRHYVRYLFLLPLLAIVTIVFAGYKKRNQSLSQKTTAAIAKTIAYHCIVADAVTKQPLPGVRVEDEAGHYLATTNSDGYFTVELPNILYKEGGAGVAVYLVKKDYNRTVSGCSVHSKTNGTGVLVGYSHMLPENAPANIRSGSAFDLSRFTTKNSTVTYEQVKDFYEKNSGIEPPAVETIPQPAEITAKQKTLAQEIPAGTSNYSLLIQNIQKTYYFSRRTKGGSKGVSREEWDKLDEQEKYIMDLSKYNESERMFIGIDNPLVIRTDCPDYDGLRVSVAGGGSISWDENKRRYILRLNTQGKYEIRVSAALKNGTEKYLGSKIFTAHSLPPAEKYDPAVHGNLATTGKPVNPAAQQQLENLVNQEIQKSQKPFLEIQGHSLVATAAGSYAMTEGKVNYVIVDKKPYTTVEVNRLFKREMFAGVAGLGVEDMSRYGIAEKGLMLLRPEQAKEWMDELTRKHAAASSPGDTVIPKFNGSFRKFLEEKLQYPEQAYEKNTQGKVIIEFIIDQQGMVSNLGLSEHSPCKDRYLAGEAIRILTLSSGLWQPALVKGKPVKIRHDQAINFVLAN